MIRDGDAALDRRTHPQLYRPELQLRIDEVALGLRELRCGAHETVGPKAFPFNPVADVPAYVVQPPVDEKRNGRVVEEMVAAMNLHLNGALRRLCRRRFGVGEQMQPVVLFAAICFSDPRASAADDERARAIARDAGRSSLPPNRWLRREGS